MRPNPYTTVTLNFEGEIERDRDRQREMHPGRECTFFLKRTQFVSPGTRNAELLRKILIMRSELNLD